MQAFLQIRQNVSFRFSINPLTITEGSPFLLEGNLEVPALLIHPANVSVISVRDREILSLQCIKFFFLL